MSQSFAPVAVAAPDAYADIAGTLIDTLTGEKSVVARVSCITFGVTYKWVGSVDGVNFYDLVASNQLGVEYGAADVAVAAAGNAVLAIREQGVGNGSRAGLRFYKLQHKNTVAASVGTSTVTGFAK